MAKCDPRDGAGHLAGEELEPPARRLVVEQDARARPGVIRFAVILRHVVTEHLSHAIGRARVELSGLPLRRLGRLAEHLRARRLVKPDAIHRSLGMDANGLEHAQDAHGRDVAC